MLDGCPKIAGTSRSETEPELGVVVARVDFHDDGEVSLASGVLPGVELRARQRLAHTARLRLGTGSPIEQLGCCGGVALAKQVEAAVVPLVDVTNRASSRPGWEVGARCGACRRHASASSLPAAP